MIDEDVLIDALKDVAGAFDVSQEKSHRILAEAQANEPSLRSSRVTSMLSRPSRGRTLLMAAAIVAIVAGVSVPLFQNEGATNTAAAHLKSPDLGPAGQKLVTVSGSAAHSSPLAPQTGATSLTATGLSSTTPSSSPKIESIGAIVLRVNKGNVESAFTKLNTLASGDGGFVDSTRAHVGTGHSGKFSYGTIVLQVPQRNFAKLVTQVRGVGHETSVSTTSSDVTTQYVDLQAHITALEASRTQYLAIMTKATTINGILAVQTQLNSLQSQIEQLQGQLNVLAHETTYGTLTLTVSDASSTTHVITHRSGIAKAWHDSVGGFISGFEWLVRLAGPALFALLALGVLYAIARSVRRALRRRRI